MTLMMVVVGGLTTIACVAVASVPMRWLERRGKPAMGSMDESLLGATDAEDGAGNFDAVDDERGAESKVGRADSTHFKL